MRDGRQGPFCWQSLAALAVLREHFEGEQLTRALAIYLSMTELANEARTPAFQASRARIARYAGVGVRTVDQYGRRFRELQLLEITRQRGRSGVDRASSYKLVDPGRSRSAKVLERKLIGA